jgi:p-cumate 2,3-dioxygenase subunit beta
MSANNVQEISAGRRAVSRADVEDFLFAEARLLDEWRLDEWLELFEPAGRFEVPTTDWEGWDSATAGFFVCDDHDLLAARVKRLKNRKAHAENPRSRTHRMISNVILLEQAADTVSVTANFVINRYRDGGTNTYVGRYQHVLALPTAADPAGQGSRREGMRFRLRRAVLVAEAMAPGARLSFIL